MVLSPQTKVFPSAYLSASMFISFYNFILSEPTLEIDSPDGNSCGESCQKQQQQELKTIHFRSDVSNVLCGTCVQSETVLRQWKNGWMDEKRQNN